MEKTIEMKGMDLGMLFGPADANFKLVEDAFASKIIVRGNIIKIDGDKKEVPVIHEVFHEICYEMVLTMFREPLHKLFQEVFPEMRYEIFRKYI